MSLDKHFLSNGKLKNKRFEDFAQFFCATREKAKSAERAGYSAKSAPQQAYQMLQNPAIQRRIATIEEENSESWIVNKNWLLGQFVDTYRKCSKPEEVRLWNDETKRMEGTGTYKFDSKGALTALIEIGKHIGFYEVDNTQKNPLAHSDGKIQVEILGSKSKLLDQKK
jgi:phage terminase small subunit